MLQTTNSSDRMKNFVSAIAAQALAILAAALPAAAAELVMLEQPGCVWCARFNAEIAPAWPKTEEGRLAPLRRVDITQDWPDDLAGVPKERFTPTFILMEGGAEIGRLRGYVGNEFFWYRIGELLAKLPAAKRQG
jgi:thioredoxin-related protein